MFNRSNRLWLSRLGRSALGAAVGVSFSGVAAAEVTRKGVWPGEEPAVSLEADGVPRNEALKRLAKQAGWSLVLNAPPGDPVDIRVQGQPAGKVLDLLLSDASYVATRDGNLISIAPAGKAAAPAAPPDPPDPPDMHDEAFPHADIKVDDIKVDDIELEIEHRKRGRDRVVTGGSLRIEKGEVVHDVSVFGGSLDVLGAVTGDIAVMGGSTHVHEGARVHGDISTVGGPLTVDDGARVGGDVDVVGGPLRRGAEAVIEGDVNSEGESHGRHGDDDGPGGSEASELARDTGSAVTRTALLFVFGAVLIALWPRRMELLKIDIAARPMKSFALGVVGLLGALALGVALCVTLVGIPFAVMGVLLGMIAAAAGTCAVLETAGAGVLNHRTKNPYVHLAAGCLGLLVIGAIPYLGGALYGAVFFIGVGALVSTRLAGLIRPKPGVDSTSSGPYRSFP